MKSIIAACGNDCSICPRMLPKTDAELTATAERWYKIGYREQVVTNDEIKCEGCTPNTWCVMKLLPVRPVEKLKIAVNVAIIRVKKYWQPLRIPSTI